MERPGKSRKLSESLRSDSENLPRLCRREVAGRGGEELRENKRGGERMGRMWERDRERCEAGGRGIGGK